MLRKIIISTAIFSLLVLNVPSIIASNFNLDNGNSIESYATVYGGGTINASGVNVRTEPWGTILGQLSKGTNVDILDSQYDSNGDGWYKVDPVSGPTGWVYGEYVTPNPGP